MGVLMTEHGGTLNNLNSYLVDRLIVKMREKMCSDDEEMNGYIRRIYLHVSSPHFFGFPGIANFFFKIPSLQVNDLWAFGWNEISIPESLTMEYPKRLDLDSPPQERKKHVEKKEFGSKESVV